MWRAAGDAAENEASRAIDAADPATDRAAVKTAAAPAGPSPRRGPAGRRDGRRRAAQAATTPDARRPTPDGRLCLCLRRAPRWARGPCAAGGFLLKWYAVDQGGRRS
jgi:hypothetical protein